MIGEKYKVILTICLIFLIVNVSLVSCTGNLLNAAETSSIDEVGNEEILGRVTCIDKNTITLAIGHESNLAIINEDSEDVSEKDQNNYSQEVEEDMIAFELTGEEKTVEITNDSVIKIENEISITDGELNDITIGCILSVQYNESNNIVSILIKNNNKYLSELEK